MHTMHCMRLHVSMNITTTQRPHLREFAAELSEERRDGVIILQRLNNPFIDADAFW